MVYCPRVRRHTRAFRFIAGEIVMATWSAVFFGLWLLSMAWIAVDNDLLGVPYFFRHLGEAKSQGWPPRFYWIHGWRLVAVVTIQVGMIVSVVQFERAAWATTWPHFALVGVGACMHSRSLSSIRGCIPTSNGNVAGTRARCAGSWELRYCNWSNLD